jgi:hypothetical protein
MIPRQHRRPAGLRIGLTVEGQRLVARVRDVSPGGLKVACDTPLTVGAEVTIATPRLRRTGRVRWSRQGFAGIALDTPLTPGDQLSLVG